MRPYYFAPIALAAIGFTHAQVTHTIVVGSPEGDTIFTPSQLNATVGDTVVYEFHQKNHTMTQSTLASPCSPLAGGFDSGFQPVAPDNLNGPFPTISIQVKDDKPIWVYCKQTGHCQKGMVMGINPGSNFQLFLSNALASGNSSSTPPPDSASGSGTSSDSSGSTSTTSAPTSGSTSSSTSGSPTNHLIIVGENGTLTFNPSSIAALPGDTVTMKFMAKNHTATESTFGDPCRKISATNPGTLGFDSGFMPVSANASDFPTFNFTVNDTNPIWGYCRQTNPVSHCGSGMVFAVNAPTSGPHTFDAFVALAKQLNGTNSTSSSSGSSGNGTDGNSTSSGSGSKNAASSAIIIPRGLISVFAVLMLGLCL